MQILGHLYIIKKFLPESLPVLSLLLLSLPLNSIAMKLLRKYTSQSLTAQISLTTTLQAYLGNLNYVRSSPVYTESMMRRLRGSRGRDVRARFRGGVVRSCT